MKENTILVLDIKENNNKSNSWSWLYNIDNQIT